MRLRPWVWPAAVLAPAVLALVVGLIVTDVQGEAAIARQQERVADDARDYFAALAREEGLPVLARALDRRDAAGAANGLRYALVSADGRMLAGADVISSLDLPEGSGVATVVEPDTHPRRRWRVLAEPLGDGVSLIVAEDLAARDALRDAILLASLVALSLTALGAAAGGLAINSLVFRRTRAIAGAAERIAAGDLSARAPVSHDGDVFDALGASINVMLGRIDELMTGMRAATDAVAHDLRSPLTRLRHALDGAAASDDAEVRGRAIDQAYAELERVTATLDALLDIARAESGLSAEMMQRVDLTALAEQLAELFGPAAEDASQTLQVEAPAAPTPVWAHEALLRQAVGNLLHNAITHAGPGVRILLAIRRQPGGGVQVEVADGGRGVPPSEFERVQQRFVRLDGARSSQGAGLGLALAAACAKLHGGELELLDNEPGLRVSLKLRGAPSDFGAPV